LAAPFVLAHLILRKAGILPRPRSRLRCRAPATSFPERRARPNGAPIVAHSVTNARINMLEHPKTYRLKISARLERTTYNGVMEAAGKILTQF
jgi:hypothetical protein